MKRADIPEQVVLDACRAFHKGTAPTPEVALADRWPAKLVLSRMEQLVGKGKLDYGVSLRTAWVVDPGHPLWQVGEDRDGLDGGQR